MNLIRIFMIAVLRGESRGRGVRKNSETECKVGSAHSQIARHTAAWAFNLGFWAGGCWVVIAYGRASRFKALPLAAPWLDTQTGPVASEVFWVSSASRGVPDLPWGPSREWGRPSGHRFAAFIARVGSAVPIGEICCEDAKRAICSWLAPKWRSRKAFLNGGEGRFLFNAKCACGAYKKLYPAV